MKSEMYYLNGNLVVDEVAYFKIDGKKIKRVVKYNTFDGLHVVYKNRKYNKKEIKFSENREQECVKQ